MQMQCEVVDAEGVRQHVQGLAEMADAVCSTEPERVVEVTVDALCVVATAVQALEVAIAGRDRSYVLRAVELSLAIVAVAVEATPPGPTTPSVGRRRMTRRLGPGDDCALDRSGGWVPVGQISA